MTPLRVVFLTHNYPRAAGDLAGAFLHPLALALRDRGHDVRVVAPSDEGRGGEDTLDGIPVSRVRYARPERERYAYTGRMQEMLRSPGGWLALGRLLAALRREAVRVAGQGPSVMHAHWWFPAGVALPGGRSAVVTVHGTDARLLGRTSARLLARRALRAPRVVTCVSTAIAARLEPVIGGPLPESRICPMPVTGVARESAGGRGLMVVGRLTAQKRVRLALEALARMRDPTIRLTIVGDGPERPALEAAAGALGVADRVTWTGRLPSDRVGAALADADLALLPARHEGLGLVAIEALLAGVPILICSDGGGLLDVAGQGGAIVSEPMPEAIARAAETMLARPGARAEAHRAGRAWAERLAPAKVAERAEGWYREALGG
ncbi:MAG: glycosyltransferase family 4 protein [Gemmatimonadales bacterium]